MTGLLRGCRAKIQRADECVKNLNGEITAFLGADPKPYLVTRELKDDSRNYVFSARLLVDVPDRFAVLAGEVIHHLRSSLDHLFAALVLRAGNTIQKRHQFPIHTKSGEFRKACKDGGIKDISVSSQKIIASVQPCNAPATPQDTILAALQDLNNIDKHRLLIVLAKAIAVGDTIEVDPGGTDIHGRLVAITGMGIPDRVEITKDAVEFFRISLAEPAPNFKANADVAVEVVFEKCGIAKMVPVIKVLHGMVAGVTHTINEFRGEFDADD